MSNCKTFEMTAAALLKNDLAALSNYYAADLTFTVADGRTFNRTQFLEFVKNTKRESFNFDDLSIRTFGNTSVVNFNRTSTMVNNDGTKMNSKSRDTAMLVKNGGRWQIVALQISSEQAADDQAATEKQLNEIMTNWGNAAGRRDAAAIDKVLAPDFIVKSPNGTIQMRAQYLEAAKNFPGDATIAGKGLKTLVMGETAVSMGTYSVTLKAGGQTVNYNYMATFVRRGGRWMPIAFHSGVIEQK